jgi:hypothetical protein
MQILIMLFEQDIHKCFTITGIEDDTEWKIIDIC